MGERQILSARGSMLCCLFSLFPLLFLAVLPARADTAWRALDRTLAANPVPVLKNARASLEEATKRGDKQQQFKALWLISRGGLLSANNRSAVQQIDRAIALAEELGERDAHAWLVYTKGALIMEIDSLEAAKPLLQQAEGMAERLRLDNLQAWIDLAKGDTLNHEGAYSAAAAQILKAYEQFEKQGDKHGMARSLRSFAHLAYKESSKADFSADLYSGEKLSDEQRRKLLRDAVQQGQEDNRKAIGYLKRALQLIDGDTYPYTVLQIHFMLSRNLGSLYQAEEYVALSEQSLALARKLESKYYEGLVHACLGEIFRRTNRQEDALRHYDLSLSLRTDSLEVPDWGRNAILVEKAISLLALGRNDEAREMLSQADRKLTEWAKQGKVNPHLHNHRINIASLYAQLGDHKQAYRQSIQVLDDEAQFRRKETERAVEEHKTRFEVHLKDADNARLRAEQREAEARRVAELRVKDAENARLRALQQEAETQRRAEEERRVAEVRLRDAENARLRTEQDAAEVERLALIRVKDAENGRLRLQQQAAENQRTAAETQRLAAFLMLALALVTAGGATFYLRKRAAVARNEAQHHKALAEAEARANQAKSTFLANMSHELRTPLNAMLGFSRVVAREPSLPVSAREDLDVVIRSGEHLYGLINQVLDLSKIEAGRVVLHEKNFDLYELLDEFSDTFALMAQQKGLRFAIDCEADVPQYLRADAIKLRQILINLLGNAFKFTREGEIALRVVLHAEDATRIRFTVSDTGPGIEAGELALLGQAFVQSRTGLQAQEGTGLGLAISSSFVQLMGGEFHMRSEPGQGTTVEFALPLHVVDTHEVMPASEDKRHVLALAPGQQRFKVLVVDDRSEGRKLLLRLLGPIGFALREAADGAEAVEVWEAWQPDLVLMDMRMPVMDGREATRRIRAMEQERKTVIIALTASSFDAERSQILAFGCDEFLRKPFQESVLFDMLHKCLGAQFVYEAGGNQPVAEPDSASLAALPEALRAQLDDALARYDVAGIEASIAAVHQHDATLAKALAVLADRFEYGRMQSLLHEKKQEGTWESPPDGAG